MSFASLDLVRACRRSRIKTRAYAALIGMGVATPPELAEAANTTIERIHSVMVGDTKGQFRPETSLVRLGVAREVETPHGPAYVITGAGVTAWPHVRARIAKPHEPDPRWESPGFHLPPG